MIPHLMGSINGVVIVTFLMTSQMIFNGVAGVSLRIDLMGEAEIGFPVDRVDILRRPVGVFTATPRDIYNEIAISGNGSWGIPRTRGLWRIIRRAQHCVRRGI